MKQLRLGLLVGALVLAYSSTSPAQAIRDDVVRVTDPFTFDDVNPCTGEAVLATGILNLTFRGVTDPQGVFHGAYNLVPHVSGVGESGATYRIVGGERENIRFAIGFDAPYADTFTSMFNVVSEGGGSNFMAQITFHITITADLTAHGVVDRIVTRCSGGV